jgi:hypothetical protein
MTTRGDEPPDGRGGAGVALLVAAALLVLVVAAAVGSERSDLGEGASPVVSDILGGVIAGGFGALVLIGAWLLVFRRGGVARPKLTGPVAPWWVRSLVAISLLVLVIVIGLLVFGERGKPGEDKPPKTEAEEAAPARAASASDDREVSVAFYAGLALAAAVVVVGIARAAGRPGGEGDTDDLEDDEDAPVEMLLTAVDESLDALEGEVDPRRAILAAYARVQVILARDGLPRRLSETEPEYLGRVLRHYGAAAEPARRLTELFERARYGAGAVDERMRADAVAAARAIRDGAAARSGAG